MDWTDQWDVKVTTVLRRLQDRSDFRSLKKQVSTLAGISETAFGQYLRSESPRIPSLRVLCALSQVLQCSLDEIVYGKERGDLNADLFERLMRARDARLEEEALTRERFFTGLVEGLGEMVRNAVIEMPPVEVRRDTLLVPHTSELQRYSDVCWLAHLTLRSFRSPHARGARDALMPVFQAVVANLKQNRTYRMLFSHHWSPPAEEQAQALADALEAENVSLSHIRFRVTKHPVPLTNSFGFLHLNWERLKEENPLLHARVAPYRGVEEEDTEGPSAKDWLGYIGDPQLPPRVDALAAPAYLRAGLVAYDLLWGQADDVVVRQKVTEEVRPRPQKPGGRPRKNKTGV